jgi:predicted dehydrogenase
VDLRYPANRIAVAGSIRLRGLPGSPGPTGRPAVGRSAGAREAIWRGAAPAATLVGHESPGNDKEHAPMAKRRNKWFARPDQIKVGVIGYGGAFNMGREHLNAMKAAGMTPFAVCDVDAARLDAAADDFPGIETYADLPRMLRQSDVNLIVHITPHNLHYKLAAQCLRAGKHVITEKPFVLNTRQCDRLIELADEHNLVVSTYHNRHWDGWIVRAVDQIVHKGAIGKVIAIEAVMGGHHAPGAWWRSSKSISGGVLYDWGCHILEYCLQVVPSQMVEVSGHAIHGYWARRLPARHPWKNDLNEDHATAIVRFADGCRLSLTVSNLNTDERPYWINFMGTDGSYQITHQSWKLRKPRKRGGGLSESTGKHPASHGAKIYYQNIADHLTGRADLVITPQWARRPIHILDLADRSARTGRALRAKYG